MRVAFVTAGDPGRRTGGYLYNARVLCGLRDRGHEVTEVVASGAGPEDQEAAARGPGPLAEPGAFDVVVVDALARIACSPHLDRWRAAVPVVALVHELPAVADPGAGATGREPGYEEPLLRSERLVAVSRDGASILRDRGAPPRRIRVISPGFDRLLRHEPAASEDPAKVQALCVAQWIPRKGIRELAEAWTSRERPGAALTLAGETGADPAYTASVRATLAAGSGSVNVAGAVDDAVLSGLYQSSDLFVLSSRYEGYGMVFAEALAHGLPVIACSTGPVPELVGREAGLLVPPEDPEALSGALDRLLGDPDLRRRLSEAACRRARDLPRWQDTVDGFEKVLKEASLTRTRHREVRP
ncbi:MAG: glycosyltransferase family 4 protein [Rubrobacter sp.]|nr:glycosyltransferase family 4 protein [Rubrobacter sp.]